MIMLIVFFEAFTIVGDLRAAENGSVQKSKKVGNTRAGLVHPFKAGDGLFISTFPDTSSFFNNVFPIDDAGYVYFPITGRVKVSKMTESELAAFIRKNFQKYSRSPNVSVRPMMRVTLAGGFQRPGLYYAAYDNSLWDVIRQAGGYLNEEGPKSIQWERNGDEVLDNITPFIEQGVSLEHMGFKSGDLVWTKTPGLETGWDRFNRRVLPILGFVVTVGLFWMTYQQTLLYAQRRY
jgi:protein involved in polysaccharide export with SLBB domain